MRGRGCARSVSEARRSKTSLLSFLFMAFHGTIDILPTCYNMDGDLRSSSSPFQSENTSCSMYGARSSSRAHVAGPMTYIDEDIRALSDRSVVT